MRIVHVLLRQIGRGLVWLSGTAFRAVWNRISASGRNPDEWKLVTEYSLLRYPCGVAAGERIRLRRELVIRDHAGLPTGPVLAAGEVWTVRPGNVNEPDTIWLCEPSGHAHTWDAASLWDWFERVAESA